MIVKFLISFIEIYGMYGILIILDRDNKLSFPSLLFYLLFSSSLSNLLVYYRIPFDYFVMGIICLVLLKLFTRQRIGLLLIDVTISVNCYLWLQLAVSIPIGAGYKNSLEDYYLAFAFPVLFVAFIWFVNKNEILVATIQRFYQRNRDIVFWVAVNLSVALVIVLSVWIGKSSWVYNEWALFLLVILNYALNILLLVSLLNRKRQKSKLRAYQEYGEYLEAIMHQLSSRQHEFANQINVLMGLAQTKPKEDLAEAILVYGERILNEEKREGVSIICDESVVAAMLYRKKRKAEQYQIQFEHLIEDPFPDYSLSVYDLVELTINLINNAFEAVAELPLEERQVFLKMTESRIEVMNSIAKNFNDKAIIKFSEIGYSTKGKQRGYGLSNVKAIVNKYNGQFHIYVQDKMIVFLVQF